MSEESKNKIAIVTGGADGIGLSTSKLLAEKNYIVIISDINEEAGKHAVDDLVKEGKQADFIKVDVSNYEEVKSLIDQTVEKYKTIDLLVNNAGIGTKEYRRASEHTLEDWDKVIAVNQSGVFYGMKVALGYMLEQGSGNIVNVASLAGVKASTTGMAYAASKFAVVGMTKSAALEYASRNIRINCICPSFTETQLLEDSMFLVPDMREKLVRSIPLKRYAQPEEMAEAIYWLASDKSAFVTGHTLVVDGGLLL